ncbi:MAG: hypothetical protein AAF717_06760 [Bacteroidota bacterium]
MKNNTIFFVLLAIQFLGIHLGQAQIKVEALLGEWKLDMTPQDTTDSNFAMMRIEKVTDTSFEGIFYREGVKLQEGRINTQRGILYGALVSGDNSGEYNTSFYLEEGKLYGSTHALARGFLAVWVAEKVK